MSPERLKKLLAILSDCKKDLADYCHYISKSDRSCNDIAGLLMLPDDLLENLNLSVLANFEKWLIVSAVHQQLIDLREIWIQVGLNVPLKFSKSEKEFITRLMDKVGFGFAPDPRFHDSKLQINGSISLYQIESPCFSLSKKSKIYDEIVLLIKLSSIIVNMGGHYNKIRHEFFIKELGNNNLITRAERISLECFARWQFAFPSRLTELKARLVTLIDAEKNMICNFIIRIVLADGKVDAKEIQQLERIYTALALDKSRLSSDIHRVATSKSQGDFQPCVSSKVSLDDTILKIHENETKDVQAMLHAIFTDDEPEAPPVFLAGTEGSQQVVTEIQAHQTLAKPYQPLLQALLQKHDWRRKDFKSLCDANNLMVNDVVEVINDWAYDVVGAPLIEEDYDFKVDAEIAEEINELGK